MIKIKFDDTFVNDEGIMSLSQDYKMFDNNFYLGATPCRSMTLEIYKDYFLGIANKVEIYDDDTLYATMHIDSCELIDKTKYKLELTDAMTNLNQEYDASGLIGLTEPLTPVPLIDILRDICSKHGISLNTESFYGSNKLITWYDNTRTARQYVGYIAELNGGYAIINANGELELKRFSNQGTKQVLISECEDFTLGEYHKITRVVYDTGTVKYEAGDDTGNTVYIDTDNVYITEQEDIDNIYDNIKNFEVYSFSTGNCPDVGGTTGENIKLIDTDGKIYNSILQVNKTLNGGWNGGYQLEVNTEQQQETQIVGFEKKIKNIYSRINRDEAQLEITAENTEKVIADLKENYYTKNTVNELVLNAEKGVTNTFSEAGGNNILKNTGLWAENRDNDTKEQNPYEFWQGIAKRNENSRATNNSSVLLQTGSFIQEADVPSGNYALSFTYKKKSPVVNASVIVNNKVYPLTETTSFTQFSTGQMNLETGEYITDPIIVTDNHIKVEFTSSADDGVEIFDIMLNRGTVKLAYSQNQNETITDTVNISRGITITSSIKDTVFRADADGVRVYDNNDNVKTEFTDKGLETKQVIVHDEAEICGTLISEVDGQTWFTRM